mgnify:FL=1
MVVDSNVVVSALLSPHGPPAQVLRLMLQRDLQLLHDARVLAEYREVLARPRFGFDPDDIRAVVDGLEASGETVMAKPLPIRLPDPDDLPFLEVAVEGRADALVTGNPRHFRPLSGQHGVRIMAPRELVDYLGGATLTTP